MTTWPPTDLSLTVRRERTTLTVYVSGELDYDTSDDLVDTVAERLAADRTPPRTVHLDFGGLSLIDSSGLSALLMIHRRTSALGAGLHLDNRPDVLERMLRITGVLGLLTAPVTERGTGRSEDDDGITGAGAT